MENVSVRQKWIVMTIPNTPTMSLRDAAKVLGISASTAYAAVKAGTFPFPHIKIGGRIVIPTAPIREALGFTDSPAVA